MAQPVPKPRSQAPRPATPSQQQLLQTGLAAVEIHGAQLGKEFANGAYAEVHGASIPCAAKILHRVLWRDDFSRNRDRFVQECRILCDCVHRNVVRFYGVSTHPRTGQTVLFMELMNETLADFLKKRYRDRELPYCIQLNLSHDIANGVKYLHTKKILHRDLSSNNVLLTQPPHFTAKITDFGMSILAKSTAESANAPGQTNCPGTPVYMPPEALHVGTKTYTEKMDSFQVGVLMLQIATKLYPAPDKSLTTRVNPESPTGYSHDPVPERVRRRAHLDILRQTEHSLLDHPILECLEDKEEHRPTAECIYGQICDLLEDSKYLQDCVRESVITRTPERDGTVGLVVQEEKEIVRQTERISELEGENASLRALVETREEDEHRVREELRMLRLQLVHHREALNKQSIAAEDFLHQLEAERREREVERREREAVIAVSLQNTQRIQVENVEMNKELRRLHNEKLALEQSKREMEQQYAFRMDAFEKEHEALRTEIKQLARNKELAGHTCHILTTHRKSLTTNETMEISLEMRTPAGEPVSLSRDDQVSFSLLSLDGQHKECPVTLRGKRLELTLSAVHPGPYRLQVTLGNTVKELFSFSVYPDPSRPLVPRIFIPNLRNPYGITVNNKRELVVCEHLGNSLLVYDLERPQMVKHYLGGKGNVYQPTGVAASDAGDVFVTTSGHRLLKFNGVSGVLVKSVGREEAEKRPVPVNQGGDGNEEFSFPHSVTVHREEIYVADQKNGRVQVFDFNLNYLRTVEAGAAGGGGGGELARGGGGGGGFSDPSDVAFDEQGRMYVAEYGTGQIRVFSPDGGGPVQTIESGQVKKPEAIHVVNNYLYVADFQQSLVFVFRTTGEFVGSLGRPGHDKGAWSDLRGITSFEGKIFVSSSDDGHIHIL